MKNLKTLLLTLLCLVAAFSVSAQHNYASKIVGLWSAPFKSSTTQGLLMLEFDSDHNVAITRSVTIEGTANAAFIRQTGTWSVNNNVISIRPGSKGELRWTREIDNQIENGEVDQSEAYALLAKAGDNLPSLTKLHFNPNMKIQQATENKLILLNPKDSKALSFTRISSYPAGKRLNIPKREEISCNNNSSNHNEGTDDVTIVSSVKNEVIVEEKKPETNPEPIFTAVEVPPSFPGGEKAMYEFLSKNIRYPEMAAQNNIQGRVTMQFVIEKDGSIGQVKVVRGKDPDLDQEAIRLVKSLPKFIPGKMNNKAVRVWYTLPVNFKLTSK